MKIWKNILIYIKLGLISPILEIIVNLIYIISFLILFAYFCENGKYYSDNQITKFIESYINYDDFKTINTAANFKTYLQDLIAKLYTYHASLEKVPIFITLNPVRITRFINKNCKEENYQASCNNNFHCIIHHLSEGFKNKCGEKYSKSESNDDGDNNYNKKKLFLEGLVRNFEGYYSSYDLLHDGKSVEINNENLNNKLSEVENFIDSKNLKFISVEINLAAPMNKNYIDLILGIEMNDYFKDIQKFISVNIFNSYARPKEEKFLFVIIYFYIVSSIINIVKLIFEIMVKPVLSIHFFEFLNEACNALLFIFLILYINVDNDLPLEIDLNYFHTHLVFIHLKKDIEIIMFIVFVGIPLRFFSVLSWWKWISTPFVKFANVFFRMFPGVIVSFLISFLFFIVFSITNYLIFQDIFPNYQTFYDAFLNAFNYKILTFLYKEDINSRIFHNMTHSKYVFIFLLFEYAFFLLSISFIISAFVHLYKIASQIEEPLQQSEYLKKMDDLIEKLKQNVEERNLDFIGIKKQILYLKFNTKNTPIKNNGKIEISLFKNSQQIISFLKYLFALKPELQFKNLISILNIVIEVNQFENFNWNIDIKQIEYLTNWLTFIGCKIPVIIFCEPAFEKNYHLKLFKEYNLIKFVNYPEELENIMNKKDFGNFIIDNTFEFSIKSKKKNLLL